MTKTNDDIHVNKKYKDTVFRKLFGENRENALSLYNAVNGTAYTNPDDLEYMTLEDVIYMKYKNDLSFLIDKTLSLYEHQSSYNPNMPLRGFLYYADLYRKLIHRSERLYSKHLLKIPRPHYIVFYNGSEKDLPDMSGSDDDEKVGRECPDDTSQRRQRLSEVEGTQHDIEAQEVASPAWWALWATRP